MDVEFKTEIIAASQIIPDVIPDEKKPLEPVYEDFEDSDEDEDFCLTLE